METYDGEPRTAVAEKPNPFFVDPTNVRNFNRTEEELQAFAIFCVCVAGKPADVTAKKVELFLTAHAVKNMTPFQAIDMLLRANALGEVLKIYRFGQYKRIKNALVKLSIIQHILDTAPLENLQYAMGPKSARFFLLNTRPNQRLAALDTHILAELRECYPTYPWIPKATPSIGNVYYACESLWLSHCDSLGVDPAEYDLEVWIRRSKINERNLKNEGSI